MKKIILILLLLPIFLAKAGDPFRDHRYDLFKVLPINSNNIVFIGNSITNMHEWWEAFESNHNIVNRGVWGTFIGETVNNIEAVAAGKPHKVFIMVGTNDLGKNGSRNIEDIINKTRFMIEHLQRVSPATQIYIQGILPSVYNREIEQLIETNNKLKDLCTEHNLTYIDLWDDLISLTTDNTHTLDGLHLKASGYQIWTKKIEEYIGNKSIYPENCTTIQSTNGIENTSLAMRATIFSMLPINKNDIVIIGDEMIHCGEWYELLNSNRVKERGAGWGYSGPGLDMIQKAIPLIFNSQSGSCDPSDILLYAGTAEINGNISIANIQTSYNIVIDKIKESAPNATIHLMSLLPTNSYATNINKIIPFNNFLQNKAETDIKIKYVDIYSDLANGDIGNSKYFSNNYLLGYGYVKVAQKIATSLNYEDITAITSEEAELNYRNFERRSTLVNTMSVANQFIEGNNVGEYSSDDLNELNSVIEEAYTLLINGGNENDYESLDQRITAIKDSTLQKINYPKTSSSRTKFWYKLYTPNRNNRYLTSNGVGKALTGNEENNYAKSQWKFVKRSDGTFDIINRNDETYLNPTASYGSTISTIDSSPEYGWDISYSNTPGLFIISSGNTQLNQTLSHTNWRIYNWSTNSDGKDRDDAGCQYKIELVTETPDIEEIVTDEIIEFTFSRGNSLTNTIVKVKNSFGEVNESITANISAAGASNWLSTNNAAQDSILCINKNTNATSSTSPLSYTLEINGLSNIYKIYSIQFRSVALNVSGNWQGATETRHCNFECSYGFDINNMNTLTPITNSSIMIANGQNKTVSFESEDICSDNGKLIIKLDLYKGSNNLGCFYGLTGITLKAKKIDDGMSSIENNKIYSSETNDAIYDLMGRRVINPTKGIYIINGKKVFINKE